GYFFEWHSWPLLQTETPRGLEEFPALIAGREGREGIFAARGPRAGQPGGRRALKAGVDGGGSPREATGDRRCAFSRGNREQKALYIGAGAFLTTGREPGNRITRPGSRSPIR